MGYKVMSCTAAIRLGEGGAAVEGVLRRHVPTRMMLEKRAEGCPPQLLLLLHYPVTDWSQRGDLAALLQ